MIGIFRYNILNLEALRKTFENNLYRSGASQALTWKSCIPHKRSNLGCIAENKEAENMPFSNSE